MGNRSQAWEDLGGSLTPDQASTDMIRRRIALETVLASATPKPRTEESERIERLARIALVNLAETPPLMVVTRETLENVYEQLEQEGYQKLPLNYREGSRAELVRCLVHEIRPSIGMDVLRYCPEVFREIEATNAKAGHQVLR